MGTSQADKVTDGRCLIVDGRWSMVDEGWRLEVEDSKQVSWLEMWALLCYYSTSAVPGSSGEVDDEMGYQCRLLLRTT